MQNDKKKSDSKSWQTWEEAKQANHVAHFQPDLPSTNDRTAKNAPDLNQGTFTGPEDAPVWFGLPYMGDPRCMRDIGGGREEPYLDKTQIATSLGGIPVEWLDYDAKTSCSVYLRLAPVAVELAS